MEYGAIDLKLQDGEVCDGKKKNIVLIGINFKGEIIYERTAARENATQGVTTDMG